MKLIKENKKGKTYQATDFKIAYRYKWTIAWDNAKNQKEIIYFISGKAKITLWDEAWEIQAPRQVIFPANTYHKIEALTDISFILFEE